MAKNDPIPQQERFPQELGGDKDQYTTAKPMRYMTGGVEPQVFIPGDYGDPEAPMTYCPEVKTKSLKKK